jgi:WD40 repeat protein
LWNVATKQQRAVLPGHGGLIFSLAFTPDGETLAVPSHYSLLQFWEVATGQKRNLRLATKTMFSLTAYAPDGRKLFATRFEPPQDAILYDATTGEERLRLAKAQTWSFNTAAFLPTGQTLIAAVYTGPVIVYDTASGKILRELSLPGHSWPYLAVAPDGRHFAVAVAEGMVFIFRLPPPKVAS